MVHDQPLLIFVISNQLLMRTRKVRSHFTDSSGLSHVLLHCLCCLHHCTALAYQIGFGAASQPLYSYSICFLFQRAAIVLYESMESTNGMRNAIAAALK